MNKFNLCTIIDISKPRSKLLSRRLRLINKDHLTLEQNRQRLTVGTYMQNLIDNGVFSIIVIDGRLRWLSLPVRLANA